MSAPLLAPSFDALLHGYIPPDGAMPLERESLRSAFVQTLRALAAKRPTILLVH